MTDQEIAQEFAAILQDAILEVDPSLDFHWRRMFGGAGYFANGKMFAGWFRGDSVGLKLPDEEREALLHLGGTQVEVINGYVAVPLPFLDDTPLLAEWLAKSIRYVQSLPDKKKRR